VRRSRALAAALVTFGAFIDLLAYSVAVPVLPDLSQRLGASPTTIGLLFASFGVTLLLAALPAGALSDRIGRRMPLVGGLVLLAASSILFAYAERLSWFFAARLMAGAADAVAWSVGFALIADLYGPDERGRIMGLAMAGSNLGLMIGPSIGGWLYEAGGVHLPFVTVAVLSLVSAAGFLWIEVPPTHAARERVPFHLLAREPDVMTCAIAVTVAASTAAMLEPVLSLWLSEVLALGPARIGLVFGIAAVASTALHPAYGRLADRIGGRRPMIAGLLALTAALPLLTRAESLPSAAALFVLLASSVALVVTPSLAYMAQAVSRTGSRSFGVAFGVYNVAWGTGLLVGPALGGFLYERLGFTILTFVWAPTTTVAALLLIRRR
jgi:DHA1 family solute carrier family 18 vesicular amine transporter 1/2